MEKNDAWGCIVLNYQYLCTMNENLTFGGYPVEFKVVDNEVYITCKGVTGTLTQVNNFFKGRGTNHMFGQSKIRSWRDKMIKIDCLQDTRSQMKYLQTHAKQLKNGQN